MGDNTKKRNVYDFDNTIYDGESTFDFFLFYAKKQPSILKYLPNVLINFAKYKLGKVTTEQFMNKFASVIAKEFSRVENLDKLACEFWDKNMNKIKKFYDEVRQPDDIIVTASPEVTVKEICRRLGISNYLCTVIDKDGTIVRMNMRENKVRAFMEEYGDIEIGDFYTDSIENDGFLAERAERVFIVKGDKITELIGK